MNKKNHAELSKTVSKHAEKSKSVQVPSPIGKTSLIPPIGKSKSVQC